MTGRCLLVISSMNLSPIGCENRLHSWSVQNRVSVSRRYDRMIDRPSIAIYPSMVFGELLEVRDILRKPTEEPLTKENLSSWPKE